MILYLVPAPLPVPVPAPALVWWPAYWYAAYVAFWCGWWRV
jgi:hypothetical protein